MKKIFNILLVIAFTLTLSSCNEIKHKELFKITDKVVDRLVNVRIEREATDKEYEDLLEDLQSHYKGNSHVNQVYRCQAGTLMIDCRN